MSTFQTVKSQLQKLVDNANAVTGKTDANVTDAQASLIAGYGNEPVLQNKTITENGTYTADSGYDGLGSVTVEVESSDGSLFQTYNISAKYFNSCYHLATSICLAELNLSVEKITT